MTDDLKEQLSRLADRATDQGDALERLHRRRARKDRSRRLGTVALALIVAVAGSWGAFAAFAGRDDDRTAIGDQSPSGIASWQPPDVLTVWPENPVRGPSPDDTQAAVDGGDESLAWRLDPELVAERFAREFLAWNEVSVIHVWGEPVLVDAPSRMLPIAITPCDRCGIDFEGSPLFLWLVQPAAEGDAGIWSVASARTELIEIDVALDASDLEGGAEIEIDLKLPKSRSAHIGLVARNGCDEITAFEPGRTSGRHTVTVPEPGSASDVDPGCGEMGAGYVFAYAQDDTTVPVGDPLLEPAAIEYPWLTIIPLYVEMIRDEATPG
jgi:hypothetical protein